MIKMKKITKNLINIILKRLNENIGIKYHYFYFILEFDHYSYKYYLLDLYSKLKSRKYILKEIYFFLIGFENGFTFHINHLTSNPFFLTPNL